MPDGSPTLPAYEVRSSKIHGTGVFAARPIRSGERILEYRGEWIDKKESERRGLALIEESKRSGGGTVYIFSLDHEWDLDGAGADNDARLINHSCDPNTEVWNEENRLWIEARRAIAPGEELTYNYGFELETWQDHPCRCGSTRCVGFIVAEDLWPALRGALANRRGGARLGNASRRACRPGLVPTDGGTRTAPRP